MIYYVIGIRRSGIHAIANWLFPMMGEFIYLNNYELGKLTDIEMVVNGNFNVIIGLENHPVKELLKYTSNGKRLWVIRDIDEVIKSQRKIYENLPDMEERVQTSLNLSHSYNEYINSKHDDFIISYNRWNVDISYRQSIASQLGLTFNDLNKEKVFGYGRSSFDTVNNTTNE